MILVSYDEWRTERGAKSHIAADFGAQSRD
jgi:hypothetical protein